MRIQNRETLVQVIEFSVVVTLGLGLFIYSSTHRLLTDPLPQTLTYRNSGLWVLTGYELLVALILFGYLRARKWTLADFNLQFTFPMIGTALVLVALRRITGYLLALFIARHTGLSHTPRVSFEASVTALAMVVVVNSFYEEALLTGYVYKRLEKLHPACIIGVSFVLRASFHTYQGWSNMPMVFTLSLVSGIYYLRYQKLWPVIIAHGAGNLLAILIAQHH